MAMTRMVMYRSKYSLLGGSVCKNIMVHRIYYLAREGGLCFVSRSQNPSSRADCWRRLHVLRERKKHIEHERKCHFTSKQPWWPIKWRQSFIRVESQHRSSVPRHLIYCAVRGACVSIGFYFTCSAWRARIRHSFRVQCTQECILSCSVHFRMFLKPSTTCSASAKG